MGKIIFDAPPRNVGLYTYSFSLANLRLSLTEFLCWHGQFFYVQDYIIPTKYPQLLFEQNKLDLKSFKDKLPPNIEENPMFQRLSRYPISVRVFLDHVIFLAGLKPLWEHGQQRPTIMEGKKEMAFRNFIYIEDDEDLTFLPKEPSPGFGIGSPSVSVNTKTLKANKEPDIQPVEVTADSRGSPKPELFDVHPGSVAARIKDKKCKTRGGGQGPLRSRELLQVIEKLRRECDVMRSRKRTRDEECEGLRVKCEVAMTDFEKNPAVVVPYATMELVHSDDMGSLVGKLVSYALVYGRCRAFEHVAGMEEPFNLSKLDEFVADPSAPIEALLLKKPQTL
nr:hypothetical protein [Tanacetum cinerariifolium]